MAMNVPVPDANSTSEVKWTLTAADELGTMEIVTSSVANFTDLHNDTRNSSNSSSCIRSVDHWRFYDVISTVDSYVIPILAGFGAMGNFLSLLVLLRARFRKSERAGKDSGAYVGLFLLACSDLMYCVIIMPRTWVISSQQVFKSAGFSTYYQLYGTWGSTTMVLCSTWITVTVAVTRWLGICHPFWSRKRLTALRVRVAYGLVIAPRHRDQRSHVLRTPAASVCLAGTQQNLLSYCSGNHGRPTVKTRPRLLLYKGRLCSVAASRHPVLLQLRSGQGTQTFPDAAPRVQCSRGTNRRT